MTLLECDYIVIRKGESNQYTEKGIISYEEFVSQVGPYLIPIENTYVSKRMAIPEEVTQQVRPIFLNFRLAPPDNIKAIAFDEFVDVPL